MNRLSVRLGVVGVVSLLAVSADLMPAESLMSPAEARSRTPVRRTTSSSDTGILASASRELASIARQATPSVVHIQSAHRSESGGMLEETGSGVIVSGMAVAGTYVITNRHVIAGAVPSGIEIHLSDGRVLRPVRIWVDDASDVGVMKIEEHGLQPAAWGDSSTLEIGDLVVALGSPFGLSQSVTLGIISAKGRRSLRLGKGKAVLNQNFLQTDAAINPGNSGGPLVDTSGRLIGINTAIASSSGGNDGIGFSIPSNLARHIADQLLQKGHVQRAY
ncbi:MAG: trypsin-like peptidase domain-containing protein, partial [Planctomycetaceae bacterium]|nr:trypsin-like peptidase domain-containing protein [Planctomycetaceae bacterium]